MKIIKFARVTRSFLSLTASVLATVNIYTDESAYLNALTEAFMENVDGPEWNGVGTTISTVSLAHQYNGAADMTGSLTLNNRLVEHQYSGVSLQ